MIGDGNWLGDFALIRLARALICLKKDFAVSSSSKQLSTVKRSSARHLFSQRCSGDIYPWSQPDPGLGHAVAFDGAARPIINRIRPLLSRIMFSAASVALKITPTL